MNKKNLMNLSVTLLVPLSLIVMASLSTVPTSIANDYITPVGGELVSVNPILAIGTWMLVLLAVIISIGIALVVTKRLNIKIVRE